MAQSTLGLGGERRYSVPNHPGAMLDRGMHSEDLHAWSIYRQNLNSDFTDSALGSTDKSPLPYGNFQLRDTTVHSILSHPRYGPKSALGSNMYTYLKFGLPRVFPPNHGAGGSQRSATPRPKTSIGSNVKPPSRIARGVRGAGSGLRETSSGYDSSDNETSMNYKHSRKYRSDPDFRLHNMHSPYQGGGGVGGGLPVVAMQAAGLGEAAWGAGGGGVAGAGAAARHKSVSEANLLGLGLEPRAYPPHVTHTRQHNRRNSVAEFSPDADHNSYVMNPSNLGVGAGGRASKAGSHLSLAHSRKLSTLRPGDMVDGHAHGHPAHLYPSYYVSNLEVTCAESASTLVVSGLSLEARGGELVGVLATAPHEARALLDVLAGVRKRLSGEIVVNGQPVGASTLRRVVGYVRGEAAAASALHPALSVEHALRMHAALAPASHDHHHKLSRSDTMNMLIEELGLEQVRATSVGRLTRAEARRLAVACQLLLDCVVLVLDQPTSEMDIFDTFFLVEYLRAWAAGGRIVIMSLHPPTYEIFAMLTKVVLTSAGRTMYSGYRRDMLPYFASIDYPCPAFKNPSDYYLDLVTLDELSAAALLESSGRIEALAAVFASQQPPLEPPPPAPLPPPLTQPSLFTQAATLLKKSLFYCQASGMATIISRLLLAATLSVMIGAIFWDLPATDPKLTYNDRVGFHYSVMCLGLWPVLLLLAVKEMAANRQYVERDIRIGLYSRTMYIIVDQFLDLLSSGVVWLGYLIPSYAMSGLYHQSNDDLNGFYYYLGYMLLYLVASQMLVRLCAVALGGVGGAAAGGALVLGGALASGALLHVRDLSAPARHLQHLAPPRWTLPAVLRPELTDHALRTSIKCTKARPYQDIIVQSQCPTPDGAQVLADYGYVKEDYIWEMTPEAFLVALAVFYGVCALLTMVVFVADCTGYYNRKLRAMQKGHKVTKSAP